MTAADPFTKAAHVEAEKRHQGDWDPFEQEPVDDWGFAEAERRAFVAGAVWARDHLAAQEPTAAEHRIARLEAQTDVRGRAVVIYRDRARKAEAWAEYQNEEVDLLEVSLDRAEAQIKAVRDVLDQAEASINRHPAYTFSGQRMDPIVNGADIRRALEGEGI